MREPPAGLQSILRGVEPELEVSVHYLTTPAPHSTTGAHKTTVTTALETHTEFPSGTKVSPGQSGFSQWLEQVEYQREGYATAGVSGRVKTCGTVPIVRGQVALGTIGKGVSIQGLHRCGSRWCAECQTKVGRHKANEVAQAMQWAFNQGYHVAMYTVTGAHVSNAEMEQAGGNLHEAVQGVDVATVRKRMSQAWAVTRNGRRGVGLRNRRVGMITAQEVTLDDVMVPGSRTGIHHHRHVLVILHSQDGMTAQETADDYGKELFSLWQAGCEKVDLKADEKGFDIQVATTQETALELGKYVTKFDGDSTTPTETILDSNLHKELVRGDGKSAGKGRVSPEQLLRNIGYVQRVAPGNTTRLNQMIAQWKDLERGTKGTNWLRWSPGLRDLVGLNDELSDEEIAQTETPVDSEVVAVVSWDELREHVVELRRVVRESADGEEFPTLLLCLDSWGIDYRVMAADVWNESISAHLKGYRRQDSATLPV